MLRLLIHVGLAAHLAIAPALCCCGVRLFAAQLAASPTKRSGPECPRPEPAVPSCCHATTVSTPRGCCREEESTGRNSENAPHPSKAPSPDRCEMCFLRTDAVPPETCPVVDDRQPTGERIPVALIGLAALPPEHLGLLGGLDPPERAGVDARSNSLFLRHVMRC